MCIKLSEEADNLLGNFYDHFHYLGNSDELCIWKQERKASDELIKHGFIIILSEDDYGQWGILTDKGREFFNNYC